MGISARVDRQFPVGFGGIANSDILKIYLGLLVQGKNDFEAVEAFCGDGKPCAGSRHSDVLIHTAPAHERPCTRLFELADTFNLALLSARYAGKPVDFGILACGYMGVDWDTFVMNNSGTKKEVIGRTYQGVDGFT